MTDTGSNVHEYTVTEISSAVKRTLEDTFGYVRVRGEVSKISRPGSGHLYFDLKDDKSVLAAVAWKGTASRWRFQPEQGLEVIVTGRMTTFPGQSKYQLIVENVEPAGVGALMALLEERRKKLAAEGLFDRERKKDLPYLPRVIGVVTSPTGAVIRDILHRLDDRFPTHVIVWPVRVQGETCAAEVSNAVRGFNALPKDGPIARPDIIIVARGGGSIEDLWGFNEEAVVRAVAESTIPVISAVGHETDITLVDHVADRRAPTPTGAAEMAVPVRSELVGYVDDLGTRQRAAMRRIASSFRDRVRAAGAGLPRPLDLLASARQRLDLSATRLTAALGSARQAKALKLAAIAPRLSPSLLRQKKTDLANRLADGARRMPHALRNATGRARLRFGPVATRLQPAGRRLVADKGRRLEATAKLLETLSYKNVLKRGFALVTDQNGTLVRSATVLDPGEAVTIGFADGDVGAVVAGSPVKKSRPKPPKSDDDQSSLF